MMFTQRQNRVTTHLSERIIVIKRRMTVFWQTWFYTQQIWH